MKVQVQGDEALAAALDRFADDLDDPARLLGDAARFVRAAAVDAAPKRTGRMAGSITISKRRGGYLVSARAPYSQFVHYGSVHNPRPVPFMDIASTRAQGAVTAAVDGQVDQAITRAGL